MVDHKIRLIVIAIGFVAALISVVVLVAMGQDEGTGFGAVLGILSTLGPALLDAQSEQKKRRTSRPPEE